MPKLRYPVPAAPIHKVIQDWLNESPLHTMTELGQILFPEFKTERGGRDKTYTVLRSQFVDFDVADKILCRLDCSLLWLEDPVLREAYMNMDLEGLDRDRPVVLRVA